MGQIHLGFYSRATPQHLPVLATVQKQLLLCRLRSWEKLVLRKKIGEGFAVGNETSLINFIGLIPIVWCYAKEHLRNIITVPNIDKEGSVQCTIGSFILTKYCLSILSNSLSTHHSTCATTIQTYAIYIYILTYLTCCTYVLHIGAIHIYQFCNNIIQGIISAHLQEVPKQAQISRYII